MAVEWVTTCIYTYVCKFIIEKKSFHLFNYFNHIYSTLWCVTRLCVNYNRTPTSHSFPILLCRYSVLKLPGVKVSDRVLFRCTAPYRNLKWVLCRCVNCIARKSGKLVAVKLNETVLARKFYYLRIALLF